MAEHDVTSFQSGLSLEDAFIELKTLLQSFVELSGGSIPPVLFTLERAFERFELVLAEHQKVLHAQMVRDTNAPETLSCSRSDSAT